MESIAYDNIWEIEQDMWWYRGRRAVCFELLRRHAPRGRVLDVGCGTGYNLSLLEEFGEVHGVDPFPEALEYCRKRGCKNVRQAGAEQLPFPDGQFGLVTAFDVIEHIQDDVAALREWHRVTAPGGKLLIYTPALQWLYGEHDRIVQHYRRYAKRQLTERIQRAGFTLMHASYVNMFVLPLVVGVRMAVALMPRRPHVEMSVPSRPVNWALTQLSFAEVPLVLGPGLPIGLSLVALAVK